GRLDQRFDGGVVHLGIERGAPGGIGVIQLFVLGKLGFAGFVLFLQFSPLFLGQASIRFGRGSSCASAGGSLLAVLEVEVNGRGVALGVDALYHVLHLPVDRDADVEGSAERQAVVAVVTFFIGLQRVVTFDVRAV